MMNLKKLFRIVFIFNILFLFNFTNSWANSENEFKKLIEAEIGLISAKGILNTLSRVTKENRIFSFVKKHKNLSLTQDLMYIAGRIDFLQNRYEDATFYLSNFHSISPNDERKSEVNLLIGYSAAYILKNEKELCKALTKSMSSTKNKYTNLSTAINNLEIEHECKKGIKIKNNINSYFSKSDLINDIKIIFNKYDLVFEIK